MLFQLRGFITSTTELVVILNTVWLGLPYQNLLQHQKAFFHQVQFCKNTNLKSQKWLENNCLRKTISKLNFLQKNLYCKKIYCSYTYIVKRYIVHMISRWNTFCCLQMRPGIQIWSTLKWKEMNNTIGAVVIKHGQFSLLNGLIQLFISF